MACPPRSSRRSRTGTRARGGRASPQAGDPAGGRRDGARRAARGPLWMARCRHGIATGAGRPGRHGVRPRWRRSARRGRGRHAAGAARGRHPSRPDRRHVGGRDQRRVRRRRPRPRAPWTGCEACGRSSPSATDLRRVDAVAGWARWCAPAPTCTRASRCGTLLERAPAGADLRRAAGAVPVRRGQHRAGRRALVHRRARWSRRCSPPARSPGCCRRSSSAASTTSTAGWCTASRSAGRSRSAPTRSTCCRSAGSSRRCSRADRPWEVGAGRLRDRPPAPVRRGHGRAARRASPCTCCPRVTRRRRRAAEPALPRLLRRSPARIEQAHAAARGLPGRGALGPVTMLPPRRVRRIAGPAAPRGRWWPASSSCPCSSWSRSSSRCGCPGGGGRCGCWPSRWSYLALEVAAVAAAAVLWVLSGFGRRLDAPAFQAAHYTVLRLVLDALMRAAQRLFALRLVTDGESWSPLDDGVPGSTNAMVVLSPPRRPGRLVAARADADEPRPPAPAAHRAQGPAAARPADRRLPQPAAQPLRRRPVRAPATVRGGDRRAGPRSGRGGRAADLPRGRRTSPRSAGRRAIQRLRDRGHAVRGPPGRGACAACCHRGRAGSQPP